MAKHDWHTDQIRVAESLLRGGGIDGARGLYDALNCYPTSTNGDVALITWHVVYHTGHAPLGVRPSRGHSYVVDTRSATYTVRITDYFDHRAGVTGIVDNAA